MATKEASVELSEMSTAPQTTPAQTSTSKGATSNGQRRTLAANTALAGYGAVRKVHKFGRHFHKVAAAFDPTLDIGDADDADDTDDNTESDNSYADSDDDDRSDGGSIRSQHSDDEEIPEKNDGKDDELRNKTEHENTIQAGNSFAKSLLKGLPATRSAKASELPARNVAPNTSVQSTAASKEIGEMTTGAPSVTKPMSPPQQQYLPEKSVQPVPTTLKSVDSVNKDPAPKTATDEVAKENKLTEKAAAAEKITAEQLVDPVLYEIVRVRKPDGTIVKVRRPIKPRAGVTTAGQEKGAKEIPLQNLESVSQSTKPATTGVESIRNSNMGQGVPKSTEASTKGPPAYTVKEVEKISETTPPPSAAPKTNAEILHRRTSRITQIVVWSVMIATPLVFIILAILTACATGKPENSSLGQGITKANKIAVSLWPIAFAACAAQALRMYASWKVEKGLKLMVLEQLINSHSVASAIKQPFLLQRVDLVSIGLLLLWSLSPISGQAFVRMSHVGNSGAVSNVTLSYLNTTDLDTTQLSGGSSSAIYGANINSLFGATLLSPEKIQQAPMDTWGNVKIPAFTSLTKAKDGWLLAPESPAFPTYTSLLGVPISGLSDDGGNSSFTIETMYYDFDCPTVQNSTLDAINKTVRAQGGVLLGGPALTLYMARIPSGDLTTQIAYVTRNFQAATSEDYIEYDYTICTFAQVMMDSNVLCSGKQCRVDKMRPSSTLPVVDVARMESDWFNAISNMVTAGAAAHDAVFSPLQFFLNDTNSAGVSAFDTTLAILDIPTKVFNARLGMLLNTYWLAGIAPYTFTGQLKTVVGASPLLTTIATMTSTAQIYKTSWGWLVLLLVTGLFLLLGGIVSAYFDSRTVGPDIFGFASSLAHKNKYMRVPAGTGDSTIGGPERARRLADVTVMLQDVRPEHPVGRIALGTVENGGAKLQLGRKYK